MPIFNYEIDPSTDKVIAGTTQVLEVTKKYTIPFTKAAVEKLTPYFRNPVGCVVVGGDSRRYSVNLEQFKSMSYTELIDMVTGFADYLASKRRGQLNEGGVN